MLRRVFRRESEEISNMEMLSDPSPRTRTFMNSYMFSLNLTTPNLHVHCRSEALTNNIFNTCFRLTYRSLSV